MFTKIFVLAVVVAIASCSNRHYKPESHKEYRHPYEHRINAQEATSDEYKPEYAHAYSSQSVVHQGQTATYDESHESTEHVAPVNQYKVTEQNEDNNPTQHTVPVELKHRHVQYPQHEIQTVRVPAHHKGLSYFLPESPESYNVPTYHHSKPHGAHKTPIYYQPESQEIQHQKVQYQPELTEPAYHHAEPERHSPIKSESHSEPIDYYAYPKYQYEYKVEDPHTGDNKFQHEIRDGDVVKGVYGLHEADGSIRTVEYSSDKHHGFSAIVKHSAPGQHVHIESHHQDENQN